jgi:hypothetical protein
MNHPNIPHPILNREQKNLKRGLSRLKEDMLDASRHYYTRKSDCLHVKVPTNTDDSVWWYNEHSKEWTIHTSAKCAICEEVFGWYCLKAPDNECDYEQYSEHCKYCSEPDERK